MFSYELLAVVLYLLLLLAIGLFSYRKNLSAADFIIGNRSMNYWLTALAAHASDMSSWLFMAYPASIFLGGLINAWAGIGLIFFMFLNWQFIAPKIRVATEQYNSLTFSSFFESRLADSSGMIRVFTAIISLLFYTVYISSALVGLGILLEILFGIDYSIGVLLGTFVVVPYVFIGGFLTLAWIDLFQGFFLLGAVLFVPLYLITKLGGWDTVINTLKQKHVISSMAPDFSKKTLTTIFFNAFGWGLGYFGQPHIITKFMGIKNAREIPKSKWIGMSWMTLALSGATLVGIVAAVYFTEGIENPEHVFIDLVKDHFPSFAVGLILCAVLATTINAMSSQVLVVSSSLTEDFYKKIFRKKASSGELLIVSRIGVVFITFLSFVIAYEKISSIYSLVLYAWSGLGSSFGPLLLLSLYSKKVNKYGAWVGILTGGITAAIWPYFNKFFSIEIPIILPAFSLSFVSILIVSYLTQEKAKE